MAKYNPKIHHRRSIRYKGYDYSKSGLYFITINCQNNVYRFGDVVNEEMKLNEFGKIAHEEWIKLEDRFPNFELDVFQIMPNHMHGIISLTNNDAVDTIEKLNETTIEKLNETTVEKLNETTVEKIKKTPVGAGFTPALSLNQNDLKETARVTTTATATIGDIIGAYKSIVANACLEIYKTRNETMGKFWQRDYYDIIIRSDESYKRISNYIENNPKNWKKDKFYRK
jgi:REP element-mobilizing transposase RayT